MDYRRYRPDPMLEPFVEWFWTLEFGEPGADPPVQKIVPDGRTELIVHYGVPMVQGREDGSFVPQQRSAFCG